MDGLTIWTVGGFQAERAARTKTLNGTQYTEKPLFEFWHSGEGKLWKRHLSLVSSRK